MILSDEGDGVSPHWGLTPSLPSLPDRSLVQCSAVVLMSSIDSIDGSFVVFLFSVKYWQYKLRSCVSNDLLHGLKYGF